MLGDRVLVSQPETEGERRTSKGILIPATAEVAKRLTWAEVTGIGPNVRAVQAGDRVLFNAEDRFEVELQGQAYYILRERDLAAIASPRVEEGGTGLYL